VPANFFDAPDSMVRSHQQMRLVPLAEQSPGQIGADKSSPSGNDDPFHFRLATTTKTAQPGARTVGKPSGERPVAGQPLNRIVDAWTQGATGHCGGTPHSCGSEPA
jgi:hypothetical protein